jgi:hypothetical protein
MLRILALCAGTAVLTIALMLTVQHREGIVADAAGAKPQAIVPPCPQARYAADGNIEPLFCVIDNPVALRHFAPMAKRTFALGPNATPAQVTDALNYDYKHGGTGPIICSIYKLAAWRNHWQFALSPIDRIGVNMPPGWCPALLFQGVEY